MRLLAGVDDLVLLVLSVRMGCGVVGELCGGVWERWLLRPLNAVRSLRRAARARRGRKNSLVLLGRALLVVPTSG